MRPAQCPSCRMWVLRDPSVVNNRVTCPCCQTQFCWLCLLKAPDKEDSRDHFSPLNMFGCTGNQFLDIRDRSVFYSSLCIALQTLLLPLCLIYQHVIYTIEVLGDSLRTKLANVNCLFRGMCQVVTYVVAVPLFILYSSVKCIVLLPCALVC